MAYILFLGRNSQYYQLKKKESEDYIQIKNYQFHLIDSLSLPTVSIPNLPDISSYNIESLKEKIPVLEDAVIEIYPLQKGYKKLRSEIPNFAIKQNRAEPVSIVILSGVVDLDAVVHSVSDQSLIDKVSDNIFTLHVPLSVHKDATLVIREGQTLRLSAKEGVMIPVFGKAFIMGAEIIGWDADINQPAVFTHETQFRPYVTAWCGSELYIAESKLSYLGYENPKSYGLTYSSCENDKYVPQDTSLESGTGWIIDNEFNEMYFGFYSHESQNIVIARNDYHNSIVYGIDPHDRSKNLIIAHNTVQGSQKKHGIIISREVSNSYIFNNITQNNAGTGIMIDRNSQHNVIAYNLSQNNGHDGLSFYESSNNLSYKNRLLENGSGGLRVRNSQNIVSQNDIINKNKNSAIHLYSKELNELRDLKIDPYTQISTLFVFSPEIIGNRNSNFSLENFNRLTIWNPSMHDTPELLISGDLKNGNIYFLDMILNSEKAVNILKINESH